MWPLIAHFITRQSRVITLPIAVIVGYVGYTFEWLIRDSKSIAENDRLSKKTISDTRAERQIDKSFDLQNYFPELDLEYRSDPIFNKNQ